MLEDLFDVVFLVHDDGIGFFILFKLHSEITHLKFLLDLQFETLQLDYIACQYDQTVHVKDCHQQILTCLFDIERIICLPIKKNFVDEKQVDTMEPCPQ